MPEFKKPMPILTVAVVILIGVLTIAFASGCASGDAGEGSAANGLPESEQAELDESAAVIALVQEFGRQLNSVQLMESTEIIVQQIRNAYTALVTPELLQEWIDAASAPGRGASSPWPDGIYVSYCDRQSDTEYYATGSLIWLTSFEVVNGGATGLSSVTLTAIKVGADWKISDVQFGPYVSVIP